MFFKKILYDISIFSLSILALLGKDHYFSGGWDKKWSQTKKMQKIVCPRKILIDLLQKRMVCPQVLAKILKRIFAQYCIPISISKNSSKHLNEKKIHFLPKIAEYLENHSSGFWSNNSLHH